jgi:hypothetical protein
LTAKLYIDLMDDKNRMAEEPFIKLDSHSRHRFSMSEESNLVDGFKLSVLGLFAHESENKYFQNVLGFGGLIGRKCSICYNSVHPIREVLQ